VNRLVALLALSILSLGVSSQENPELERRVTALSAELRCLVCQNQTLADSNAPLAVDLRSQIREQLGRGSSESEVIDFMTARYGDFVLYRPPLKASTLLLWAGPFLLLAGGALLLIGRLRKERPPAAQLSDEDRMRAARLLEGGGR
jgi:cytochrome c-type biogenesis protein CcmH